MLNSYLLNCVTGVVHPVGPEAPEVYWRRRIVAGLILLAVLGLIFKVAFGGSAPSNPEAIKPVTSPSAKVTPTKSAQPVASTPSKISSVAGTCKDKDLKVSILLNKKSVPTGSGLALVMSVKNISKSACTRDLGSGANEVTITSGPALVWSTDHCNPSTSSDLQTIQPSQKWSVNLIWDGNLSAKKCQNLGKAAAGAYWAHAQNGDVENSAVRFVIK